ncbi:hypothetical protein B0H10DRAFT_2245062 [Mycena sp. CBHHK59/15]|nr:hypothetical protein B0H10DRAFT_2245062 [Mycena sp. CBHHK59/15]
MLEFTKDFTDKEYGTIKQTAIEALQAKQDEKQKASIERAGLEAFEELRKDPGMLMMWSLSQHPAVVAARLKQEAQINAIEEMMFAREVEEKRPDIEAWARSISYAIRSLAEPALPLALPTSSPSKECASACRGRCRGSEESDDNAGSSAARSASSCRRRSTTDCVVASAPRWNIDAGFAAAAEFMPSPADEFITAASKYARHVRAPEAAEQFRLLRRIGVRRRGLVDDAQLPLQANQTPR